MTRTVAILLVAATLSIPARADEAPSSATTQQIEQAVFFATNYFNMGEYASAYSSLVQVEALCSEHPALLYNMALVLAKLQRYPEAQARIDRYKQLFPEGPEAELVKQLQFALEFQRELQKKRQADADYMELFNRGKYLVVKGDIDEALKIFLQAESQRPDDPAVAFNQAVAYEKQGEFVKATERLRRHLELQQGAADKSSIDAKIFELETEIRDMQTKILCPFCGHKLPQDATWCHRCWHGPYYATSARWNSRACDSATRSTMYLDGRVARNEDLPCFLQGKTWRETLRYTPAKQRAIQAARKAEGWSYEGDVIQGWADAQGNQVKLEHGDYLRRWVSLATGEILEYEAHRAGDVFLLDREDFVIDGIRHRKHYTFDDKGRIVQERTNYVNSAGCNHQISVTADYTWENDEVKSVRFRSWYDGYTVEGSPQTEWIGNLTFAYDASGRIEKEEFILASAQKTFTERPVGAMRDEIGRLYPGYRVKKPNDIIKRGDFCFTSGTALLGNPIDLRPFYTISPNITNVLPYGSVTMATAFTYPVGFSLGR